MPKRPPPVKAQPRAVARSRKPSSANTIESSSRTTVSGPALKPSALSSKANDALSRKLAATATLAAEFPDNATKGGEHGHNNALAPSAGANARALVEPVLGSTLSERNTSPKLGTIPPQPGMSPGSAPLERVRANAAGLQRS
jgi:catalase